MYADEFDRDDADKSGTIAEVELQSALSWMKVEDLHTDADDGATQVPLHKSASRLWKRAQTARLAMGFGEKLRQLASMASLRKGKRHYCCAFAESFQDL